MTYEEHAVELVKKHEGYRDKLYYCTAGKPTLGYGRNLEGKAVPKDVLDLLFRHDMDDAIKEAKLALGEVYFTMLPDNAKVVLIDMVFNMGYTKLLGFKLFLAALRKADWKTARTELLNSKAARDLPVRYNELASLLPTGETK